MDTVIPGRKKPDEVMGDTPNLFTTQEVTEQNETEPTPEEIDQHEMIVARVGSMIMKEPSRSQIISGMKGDNKDIPTAIGMMAAKLFGFAEKAAKSQGVELSPAAANNAFGQDIIPLLIEQGVTEGLWDIELPASDADEKAQPKEWKQIHQQAAIIASEFVGQMYQKEGRLETGEARNFLKSQGVSEDAMIPAGMTPVAGAVRRDTIRRQQGL